jgi:large subunit ribosomal protein L25
METTPLTAIPREGTGTKVARREREAGRLPAIIYGHKETPEPVTLLAHDIEVQLAHGARVLNVDLNGRQGQYLIKEVQYDYKGTTPIHLDLMRVDLNEQVRVVVAIELRGTPKGLSDGGVLEQNLNELEVECLVTQIPETLRPLISHLGVNETLLVKDLELPEGVKSLHDPEERVATVRVLAEEPEAEAEAVAEEEAAQPEVIGRRKEEAEESSE